MPEQQKILCNKCRSHDFDYDDYWKEYSCRKCGWIVEDAGKISALNTAVADPIEISDSFGPIDVPSLHESKKATQKMDDSNVESTIENTMKSPSKETTKSSVKSKSGFVDELEKFISDLIEYSNQVASGNKPTPVIQSIQGYSFSLVSSFADHHKKW